MSTFIPPAPPASTPPSLMVPPVAYGTEETAARGSYGPVIGMLVVVVVLAAAAVAVGRLCFGRRTLGGHDPEAWVERTCGPCVGVVRPAPAGTGGGGAAAKDEEGGAAAASVPAATEQPPEGTERGELASSGGGGGS